uniref:Uncharacterized protein n=1 Tax=Glossina austeni TaxID=7395 RepID=A0A1A9UKV6_GLOAU
MACDKKRQGLGLHASPALQNPPNTRHFESLTLHIFYNKRKSISDKCPAVATVQTNSSLPSPSTVMIAFQKLYSKNRIETLKSLWLCNAQKHMEFVYKETVDSSAPAPTPTPTPTQNSMNSLHAYAYLCLSVMRIRMRRSQGSRLRQTH